MRCMLITLCCMAFETVCNGRKWKGKWKKKRARDREYDKFNNSNSNNNYVAMHTECQRKQGRLKLHDSLKSPFLWITPKHNITPFLLNWVESSQALHYEIMPYTTSQPFHFASSSFVFIFPVSFHFFRQFYFIVFA